MLIGLETQLTAVTLLAIVFLLARLSFLGVARSQLLSLALVRKLNITLSLTRLLSSFGYSGYYMGVYLLLYDSSSL